MFRTALVWSLLTRTPFRMVNIRARRRVPGLKAQHVGILRALLTLGPVGFSGGTVGSAVVEFHPARLRGVDATVDIGTAGSIPLLLQTLLPAALLAEGASRLRLIGGTDVAWSPPLDFLREVGLAAARDRAAVLTLEDGPRRGFYPRGGGEVILEAGGWREAPAIVATDGGGPVRITVHSVAAASLAERRVAERQSDAAAHALRRVGVPVRSVTKYSESLSPGSVVTCVVEMAGGSRMGGSSLGERGKSAETVGTEAAESLVREIESGACVDSFSADQLIPWLALAGGAIRTSAVTEHTRTNIDTTEAFMGRLFEVDGGLIRCGSPIRKDCYSAC